MEPLTPCAAKRMRCQHCGFWNAEDEHRCARCQSRLRPAGPTDYVAPRTAAVPAPRPEETPPERPAETGPYQRPLPLDPERKIIPFESIAPGRIAPRAAPPQSKPGAQHGGPKRKTPVAQQAFDFAPPPVRLQTAPQPAVYCDAPVAPAMRRFAASATDGGLVLAGFGLFLVSFHLLGGRISPVEKAAPYLGGVLLALTLFYKAFWCILGRDSMGLHMVQLRLLNFDGHPPTPRQRVVRLVAACLSVAGIGAGLLWALLDREKLTWHDHISKTFLTVYDRHPSPFQRK